MLSKGFEGGELLTGKLDTAIMLSIRGNNLLSVQRITNDIYLLYEIVPKIICKFVRRYIISWETHLVGSLLH